MYIVKCAVAMLALLGSVTAFAQSAPKEETMTTLQDALDARKKEFDAVASDAKKATYNDGIQQIVDSGMLDDAVNVGDKAPGFTLPNATGEDVSLASLLAEGPVVLTWYRGGWCPYCNLTLRAYQQALPALQAAGATFVAISPETPNNSLDTKEKNELAFEVLSDVGNEVAEQYDLDFTLPQDLRILYDENFSLPEFNGDNSYTLPLSATYVIAPDGTVTYAFLDADYRKRAEPAKVVEAVQAINTEEMADKRAGSGSY